MIIFFIVYTAIVVFAAIGLHINYTLKSTAQFDAVVRVFLWVIIVHTIHAALFRDVFPDSVYVDRGAPFGWIYGPLLYFAFRTSRHTSLSKKDGLHVLPFLLAIPMYVYFLSSEPFRTDYAQVYYMVLYGFMSASWLGYSLYVLLSSKRQDNTVNEAYGLTLIAVIILFTLTTIMLFIVFNFTFKSIPVKSKTSGLFIFLAMLGAVGTVYVHYFRRLISHNMYLAADSASTVPSYQKSAVNTVLMDEYMQRVHAFMIPDNYLDATLSLDKVAATLSIPRHHLSQLFSQHFGCSFSKHINTLRVEYACQLLVAEPLPNIETMATLCGFKSRASFYRNFNQEKGCSPLEYREAFLVKSR